MLNAASKSFSPVFVQLIKMHVFMLGIVTSERKFAVASQTTGAVGVAAMTLHTHPSLIISLSLLLLSEVLNCCQNQYKCASSGIFYPTVVLNISVKRPINFRAPSEVCSEGSPACLPFLFLFLFFFLNFPFERGQK